MPPEAVPTPNTSPLIGRRELLLGFAGAGTLAALGACSFSKPGSPNVARTDAPSPSGAASPEASHEVSEANLAASDNPDLQLLVPYEAELGQPLPETMSFLSMPTDEASADELADRTAGFARDCEAAGIKPRFIMEPTDESGQGIDLNKITDSAHTGALHSYLQGLKKRGITGKQLGTFVPLPEPSIPEEWNGSTDPELFGRNFTAVASTIKETFPDAQICMMLDSASFPSGDWGARTYDANPLLAYTNGVPAGLVDEFGLQGFPRVSGSTDPHQLIQHDVAIQAAKQLQAKRIWINTGTYAVENDPDSKQKVSATLADRAAFLQAVGGEVASMRQSGMEVRVNIFAADKLQQGEANWHYTDAEFAAAVKPFAEQLKRSGASLTIFDERS